MSTATQQLQKAEDLKQLVDAAYAIACERCAKVADELADVHSKDGKPDMELGSRMVAEAIRTFLPSTTSG